MVYEYICDDCRQVVEISKPLSECDRLEPCGNCDSYKPMRRIISRSGIQFRGGGWAADGYSKK